MKDTSSLENKLLDNLHLQHEQLSSLPPDIRTQLLNYAQAWATPQDLLEIVDGLREAHGPLLFLLDYQALAYFQQNNYEQCLATVERRLRRSTNIASQILEARALLASGHEEHAQAVADDISQAHTRNADAINIAAAIYAGLGRFDDAREMLDAYLNYRPNDLRTLLTLGQIALDNQQADLANEYLTRLGSGIPSNITDLQLREFGVLLTDTGQNEGANAVQLEPRFTRKATPLYRTTGR